nr:hypothetical protein [Lachnospiraceae bacterium]
MFKKTILSAVLLLGLLLMVAACGKKEDPTLPGQSSAETTTAENDSQQPESTTQPTTTAQKTKTTTTQPTTEPPMADYPYEPTGSGIYVTRDGVLKSAEVTSFDNRKFPQVRYNEAELKEFIDKEVKAFNDSKKKNAVTVEDLTVKSGEATLVLNYADFDSFLEFQGTDFGVKHLALLEREDAVRKYNISNLVDTAGVKTDLLIALQDTDIKVLVVTGKTLITLNGDILYMSSGMTMTGVNMVRCEDDVNYSYVVFR